MKTVNDIYTYICVHGTVYCRNTANTIPSLLLEYGIISTVHTSKINHTPKGVRLSEKLQLTAALCNEN